MNSVPSHGTASYRINATGLDITPTGIIFNTFSLKCLTDNASGNITFANCDGSEAQAWNVRSDGTINSLLRPSDCLVDSNDKLVSGESGCQTNRWTYRIGGNLVDNISKNCLTESSSGAAILEDCGYLTNEQVFSLPIGTKVAK